MENSTPFSTSQKSLPRNWMQALHRKLSMIYMEKFTRFFPDDATVEDWMQTWGDELHDLTGEEIKYGLAVLAKDNPWPPTMAEFRACCKAAPKPYLPTLEAPKRVKSAHAEVCMAKIRLMMENPRKPGVWWKREVFNNLSLGKKVSVAALDLARSGRQE